MPAGTEGRSPRRARTALGVVALIVAIGLGAAGAWLIVTGDTKQTKIGVLLGLWGLLLGAYQIVGGRHAAEEAGTAPAGVDPAPGTAVETRENADVLRQYEQRLEAMLRRQIELMGTEMATMRAELATLRSELVEKVGGQLRLERTETTRLIGSDIGALQNEVRQLAMRSALAVTDAPTLTHAPVPAAVTVAAPEPAAPEPAAPEPAAPERAASRAAPAAKKATPASAPVVDPASAAPPTITAARPVASQPADAPVVPNPYRPEPAAARVANSPAAAAGPASTGDPFANLPRLTPFRDDSSPDSALATSPSRPPTHGAFDAALGLTGPSPSAATPSGRHSQSTGTEDTPGGGRRRRSEEGGGTNVLAQILNRERASRS